MSSARTCWYEEITSALKAAGETWEDVLYCTLSKDELGVWFDGGYGGSEGKPFTLWTTKRVYFPVTYDGSEWVASVPRNPCNEATNHVGGE